VKKEHEILAELVNYRKRN